MLPMFADPKTDVVFKRIFGDEARKPLLIALLNDLLELEGPRRIREVEHLTPEQHVALPALKLSIVDVKCKTASGRRFVVEMQVLPVEGFEKRVVYNAAKAYVMQLRSADDYPNLSPVVGVTICNFNLWPRKIEGKGYKVPMLSRWRMHNVEDCVRSATDSAEPGSAPPSRPGLRPPSGAPQEQKSKHKGLSQIQHAFMELPKYDAGSDPRTLVDRWAYFFREAKNLEVIPPALSEGPFREAMEVARSATFTPREWEAYERSKMAEQDERGALSFAHREGVLEGKAEGKAEAILAVLSARGVAVNEAARVQIEGCRESAKLDLWIVRAATAGSAAEVLV